MNFLYANIKTLLKNSFFLLRLHLVLFPIRKALLKTYYLIIQSEWIHKNRNHAKINDFYSSKYEVSRMFNLFDFINTHEIKGEPIHYLEFGVFKGDSIKWWVNNSKNNRSRFYGFDTFTGLPEDFGMIKKGGYSANNLIPEINNSQCNFIQGLFQETLFPFLKDYTNDYRKVIHIDCDLYSSTLYVLTTLGPYLRVGDIIIFDEFVTPTQEFKAFHDFYKAFYLEFEMIGGVNNFHQTAVQLKRLNNESK